MAAAGVFDPRGYQADLEQRKKILVCPSRALEQLRIGKKKGKGEKDGKDDVGSRAVRVFVRR